MRIVGRWVDGGIVGSRYAYRHLGTFYSSWLNAGVALYAVRLATVQLHCFFAFTITARPQLWRHWYRNSALLYPNFTRFDFTYTACQSSVCICSIASAMAGSPAHATSRRVLASLGIEGNRIHLQLLGTSTLASKLSVNISVFSYQLLTIAPTCSK
jgi:hypothetical protein